MQVRSVLALLSTSLLLALTGCALSGASADLAPASTTGALTGHAFGGQQPVTGATVYLVQASTDGSPATILNGAGAVTDQGGAFNVTGTYRCTAGHPVYALARGGNPGLADGTTNPGIALMAVLGTCPAAGGDLSSVVPSVVLNEVTTVAAAYALAPFMSGPTTLSTAGTANGATGLPAAFATAANLVDITIGTARATTPAGNGVVPVRTINTLADIIATCINSNGAIVKASVNPQTQAYTPSSPCFTLFSSTADRAGNIPTDTLTALLNLARSPGSHDVPSGGWTTANLYSLLATQAPFQPSIARLPTDFTIEIAYSGGGLASPETRPRTLAIDAVGNVWTLNSSTHSVSLFSNLGVPLSPAAGFAGAGVAAQGNNPANALLAPVAIAVNAAGNAVIVDRGDTTTGGSLRILNPSGATETIVTNLNDPLDVAVNGTGASYFVPAGASDSVYAVNPAGANPVLPLSLNGVNSPQAVAVDNRYGRLAVVNQNTATDSVALTVAPYPAVATYQTGASGMQVSNAADSKGNLWTTFQSSLQPSASGVLKQDHNGVPAPGSPFTAVYMLSHPNSVVIDGADGVFVASSTQSPIFQLDSDGKVVSGYNGLVGDVVPTSLAIDPSGNVWFRNANDATLRELVGLASSTVTPLWAQNQR